MQLTRHCRYLLLLLVLLLSASFAHAAPPTDIAVAYQINQAHTGQQTSLYFTLPLVQKWSVDLGYDISYPLIAQGMVFVTVGDNSGSDVLLETLDLSTGLPVRGAVSVKGTYWFANACYDSGRIFVVNYDGRMSAFNAATGAHYWTIQCPGQYAFSSPPTASKGIVYTGGAGSGGTVYAIHEKDGAVLWTASVENGDNSSPVVTGNGVYVSYVGPQTYKFNPITGSLIWHYNSGIEGGGGGTPTYYNGLLYTRDWSAGGSIFNATTGALVGTFGNGPIPSFYQNQGFFMRGGTLDATNLSTLGINWSYSPSGDPFVTASINVNGVVYAGTGSGNIYALDSTTGKVLWQDDVGSEILGPDEQNVSQPLTGLGEGQGALIVPAGHMLVAYGPATNGADVTSTLTIQAPSFVYNPTTHHYDQTVTLTNNSSSAISGPFTYIFDNLSTNATVIGANGETIWTTPAHSPYLNLKLSTGTSLGTGQQLTFTVHCSKSGTAPITYTPRVLAGPGGR